MILSLPAIEPPKIPSTSIVIKQEIPKQPKLYKIVENDKLETIAKAHNTTVERLFRKNQSITHPDTIKVGETIEIPSEDEVLPEREVPVIVEEVSNRAGANPVQSPRSSGGFSSSVSQRTGRATPGWYYAGQCTGYVASRRYVPDGWGNASDWKYNAQHQGWTVSSVPVNGAIGWTSGHVVYVESVNGDGTVTISEQNYDWNGSIRTITVPVSKYTYIY